MSDRRALFSALQRSDLETFAATFLRSGRGPASRHALRIDGTRYASSQVRADDGGSSALGLIGFTAGLLLADRLSGPLAPFTRPASAQRASAQAFWLLRGDVAEGPDLPDVLFIGDLPQDLYALSHALFVMVKDGDAIQAAEVVDRLLDRGIERDRLVGLLARVVTERSTHGRPLLLLSMALQLSARLGGDEVGNLLRATVNGTIAAQNAKRDPELPARAELPPELEEELPHLLAQQVNAAGVTDLRRVRAQVREGRGDGAWRAIHGAIRAKVGWLPLVDMMSLEAAGRLMRVRIEAAGDETGAGLTGELEAVLDALAQVRAVRWLMTQHPSPGALKGVLELAAQLGWLEFTSGPDEAVLEVKDQNPTRLLNGLREAFHASDRAAASGYVARYRELNLPREALAGALVEEALRGGRDTADSALRLLVTEAVLAEAEALYGSMEEGAYYQGLARVLTALPHDGSLVAALERGGG